MKYSIEDLMPIVMARLIRDNEKVFVGISSPLALIAALLAKKLIRPSITLISVTGAIDPDPEIPPKTTSDNILCFSSIATYHFAEAFDLCVRGELDVVFLRGAQIDKFGNVNISVIGSYDKPKVRLPGGATLAMFMSNAKRIIYWTTRHDKRNFVDKVDFITGTGNTEYVVTPLCIFKMDGGRLKVWRLMPNVSIDEIIENTGFKVEFISREVIEEPNEAELKLLREIDPHGVRRIEFK